MALVLLLVSLSNHQSGVTLPTDTPVLCCTAPHAVVWSVSFGDLTKIAESGFLRDSFTWTPWLAGQQLAVGQNPWYPILGYVNSPPILVYKWDPILG